MLSLCFCTALQNMILCLVQYYSSCFCSVSSVLPPSPDASDTVNVIEFWRDIQKDIIMCGITDGNCYNSLTFIIYNYKYKFLTFLIHSARSVKNQRMDFHHSSLILVYSVHTIRQSLLMSLPQSLGHPFSYIPFLTLY